MLPRWQSSGGPPGGRNEVEESLSEAGSGPGSNQ